MPNDAIGEGAADMSQPDANGRRLLFVVAGIVLCEAAVLIVLGVLGLIDTDTDRIGTGIGSAVLLAGFGVGLIIAAIFLVRGRAGARPPVLIAQLIQMLIATNFKNDVATALALAVPAVTAAVILISPPVNRHLAADESD